MILSVGYVNNSFAAAFQLIEQSGKGAGNPAGMMRLSGHQTEMALHVIIPKFDFAGSSAFNAYVNILR